MKTEIEFVEAALKEARELQHRLNNVCDHLVASLAALRERDAAAAAHLAEERLRVDKESRETLSRMIDAGLNLAQQAVTASTSRKTASQQVPRKKRRAARPR